MPKSDVEGSYSTLLPQTFFLFQHSEVYNIHINWAKDDPMKLAPLRHKQKRSDELESRMSEMRDGAGH